MTQGYFFSFCLGITVACIGYLFFSTKRLEINLTTRKVSPYTMILGFPIGKSISLDTFKFITIISQTYSRSSSIRGGANATSNYSICNVLLLNETHHLKQLVGSYESYETALTVANRLAEKLNLPVVKYDPVRTRKSKR